MRFLPRTLFGRLVLVLLTGLILAQTLSALVLLRDRGQTLYQSIRGSLIERTLAISRLMDSLSPPERQRLLPLLTTPELRIGLAAQAAPATAAADNSGLAATLLQELLLKRLPAGYEARVSLNTPLAPPPLPPHHRHGRVDPPWLPGAGAYMHGVQTLARHFHIQVRLRDGTWLRFERGIPDTVFASPTRLLIVLLILLLSVLALSLLSVRWIVRPLGQLRLAAEGFGKDLRYSPLRENGPLEVRQTARAFNIMQQRLKSYIEERARILAAISHDLKTPLTRMRLRTELLDDAELSAKMQADLADMEMMVSASLDFMRGTENGEASIRLDFMALLESLCENALDAGWQVSFRGEICAPYQGRPSALKRCLGNLLDNAVRYGKTVEVVASDGETIRILVQDRGPGIPEDLLERVFDPFFRLESSRARHTGGTGLGLGIARNIARAHGGDLVLRNRSGGGLCAELTLPR
jgi:signal transduction histidine kinase